MINLLDALVCPTCGQKLFRENSSLKCPYSHTFDVSKSGYVNLLPPGKEKNSRTGDEKIMVKARTDFLSKGLYDNLSLKIAEILADRFNDDIIAADLGSGDGYHTFNYTKEFAKNHSIMTLGFDASKYAAEHGMKLSRAAGYCPKTGVGGTAPLPSQLYFFPANIFSLPIADNSVNACVSMFAPVPWSEAARILDKDDGVSALIIASSGKNHLMEMRQLIYNEVRVSDFLPEPEGDFVLQSRENLTYKINLQSADDIRNLFMMTPFYYKTTGEGRDRLYSKDSLEVTVDVNYSVFALEK